MFRIMPILENSLCDLSYCMFIFLSMDWIWMHLRQNAKKDYCVVS